MKLIDRCFQYAMYYLAGAIFFIVSFVLNLLCLLALALPFRARLARPWRSLLFRFYRFWVKVLSTLRVARLEAPVIDEREHGSIWVMNHPTVLDGAYLLSLVRNGTCIYKQQIASNPFYGGIARLANYIPNLGGPDMIRLAVEALGRGETVVIFPEGTRSARFVSERMKSGFALMAKRANVPIKVFWSDNPPDFATKETSKWIPPILPVSIPIRLLEVVHPSKEESAEHLKRRVAAIFEAALREKELSQSSA